MRGIDAGAIGFGVYVGDCYHADDAALVAMESTDIVAVQRLEDGARDLLLEAHPTADEIAVRSCEDGAGKQRTGG